ncbi:uncharacterized protein LOC133192761 [Saccostrea echinata]|uniref:uncharacterized protein LOC133192761 n=1 Tax=Saccostrea echinata TaxID=191078 RepID=UPI002A7F875B|nr:uncharacterized protein LOC133192761 [Saccostrea echinata]
MQTSSIVASVAISCFLHTVIDFFKDNLKDDQKLVTNVSQIHDLKLNVLNHEKWVNETLQGNITALESKLTKTEEAALGECQKITSYLQTNKMEMQTLVEKQREQQKFIIDQESRLRINEKAFVDMEKKLDKMENELLKYKESRNGQIDTTDPPTSLIQVIQQQSQAYLPITVFLLTVGEVVLFILVIVSRRVKIAVPSENGLTNEAQKNHRKRNRGKIRDNA